MKPSIFLELERLRHANVGLYSFCDNLGDAISLDKSFKPTFFVPQSHADYYSQRGVSCIVRTGKHKLVSPVSKQHDVVHITHQFSKYLPQKHPNIILTVHDLNFLYTADQKKRQSYLARIQKNVDKSRTIVAISDYVMADLQRHLNLDGKHLKRIYNGVHVQEFPEFDTPSHRPQVPFLFSLGVLLPKKNTHTLPCLLKDNDYELLLAGNPDDQYVWKIDEQARKHGVQSRVKILGAISEEEKYWYYKHCLAYLQPSLSEGFGLPVIEAMRFGKPVFLSDKTCLPEIGGKTAFYFHNFDPESMQQTLAQQLDYAHQNSNLTEAITQHSAQFTWPIASQQYSQLYHQTLQS